MVFYNIKVKNISNERFSRYIRHIGRKEDFKYFTMDAQASLLDDYLKWRPQDEYRIRDLVQKEN